MAWSSITFLIRCVAHFSCYVLRFFCYWISSWNPANRGRAYEVGGGGGVADFLVWTLGVTWPSKKSKETCFVHQSNITHVLPVTSPQYVVPILQTCHVDKKSKLSYFINTWMYLKLVVLKAPPANPIRTAPHRWIIMGAIVPTATPPVKLAFWRWTC